MDTNTALTVQVQRSGDKYTKAAGVYVGRKPSIDAATVARLKSEGLGPTDIAKRLGIGRASVYRVLESRQD